MIENLYELFHDIACRFPKKIALVHEGISTTFAELAEIIEPIAQHFQQLGVKPGEHIGLMLESSTERIATILAILKLGNVYMPLSPTLEKDALNQLLAFANISTIVYSPAYYNQSIQLNRTIAININDIAKPSPASLGETHYRARRSQAGDLAYLMRTSGSTGTPKIVMGTHSGTLNRLRWGWHRFPYKTEDVCCNKASLLFVDAVAEIFSPLLQGIPLVIFDDKNINELKIFSESIRDHKVTHLSLVPSLLATLFEDHHSIHDNFKSIHTWICSGETLRPKLACNFIRLFPNARLLNLYGSTEVSADCSYYEVEHSFSYNCTPIGVPIDNLQVEIFTEDNLPAATNTIGEIVVSGLGLAKGYYNNPQLNQERFISVYNKRYYKTGDLGSMNAKGLIFYHGRKDDRINIGGEKYYLNEISDFIKNIPNTTIKESHVLVVQNRLLAFVACAPQHAYHNRQIILDSLHLEYRSKLPIKIITLEKIPLNQSGKIDRIALMNSVEIYRPFEDDHQSDNAGKIKKIWQIVLNTSKIDATDNFFELGGNSLAAIRLVSSVRKIFNLDISVKLLFENPTLEGFSIAIEKIDVMHSPDLSIDNIMESKQLTQGQQHILFSALVSANPYLFNIVINIKMDGNLSVKKLRLSLDKIWNQHDSLRTIFERSKGSYCQSILRPDKFPLAVMVSNPKPASHSELIRKAKTMDFDLENGPLVKAFLMLNSDTSSSLIVVFHHTIIDDISIDIFLQYFANYYNDMNHENDKSSHNSSLRLMQLSYLQIQERQEEHYRISLKYWLDKLLNVEKITLATDYPRRALIRNQGDFLNISLPGEIQDRVFSIAKEHNTTVFCVIISAFSMLLKRYSPHTTIPISMPVTTRGRYNDEDLIGYLTNFITIVLDITVDGAFIDNLLSVRHALLEAMEHKHIPLADVLTGLKKIRSLSISPLSNVMVISQSNHNDGFHLDGLTSVINEENILGSNTDISLIITEGKNSLALSIEYDTDLFAALTIEKMRDQLIDILTCSLASPKTAIPTHPLLPRYNTAAQNPLRIPNNIILNIESSVGMEFERTVRLNPQDIALIHNNTHYSYLQLSQDSNQVAHYLLEHGLKLNELVGIVCCRSIQMVVFLLGILKAGGCFLLLDPNITSSINVNKIKSLQLKFLVASSKLHSNEFSSLQNTVKIPTDFSCFQHYPTSCPNIKVLPSHHCYYILTSGTTGLPKIAMNHHRGLLYHSREKAIALKLGSDCRILQTAPIQSDIVIWQLLGPLLSSGLTVIVDNVLDFPTVLNLIKQHQLTVLQLVPSIIDLFIEYIDNNKGNLPDLDSLKWLISIGEVLTAKTVNAWLSLFPKVPIVNSYGPAECADTISMEIIEHSLPLSMGIPLGRCFDGTTVLIFDADEKEVPANTRGQICISGPGVGYGYYQNVSLSMEKFIPNPRNPQEMLYCTGDMGKITHSGELIFFGREDQQHKRYGYRFDLNDISHTARTHHLIKSSSCQLIDDKIVLFYVAHTKASLARVELNDYLVLSLPVYAIPDVYYEVDCFKYLSGGKLDLKYLEAIYLSNKAFDGIKDSEEDNRYDKEIMSILECVLKVNNIKNADNFFMIGGNSLDALRFCNEISHIFEVDITLRDVLLAPTISDLARRIVIKSKK